MKEKISQLFNFVKRNKFKLLPIFLLVIFLIPDISYGESFLSKAVYGVVHLVSIVILYVAQAILKASVSLFDNLLLVTLSPNFYDMDFVKMGWGVLRDFANVAFILGIIIIGFYMIVGRSEGVDGWKRMLLNIIIAAIAMNFSLFVGRVIIDMGNFTAGVFYRMTAVGDDSSSKNERTFWLAKTILGDENVNPWYGKKSFGAFLNMSINIRRIEAVLNNNVKTIVSESVREASENDKTNVHITVGDLFTNSATSLTSSITWKGFYHQVLKGEGSTPLSPGEYQQFFGVDKEDLINWSRAAAEILSIVLTFLVAKIFFVVAFTFLARTGLLIFALIKAPVYFAWSFMPGGDQAFKKWFTEIATKSFCIVVFTAGLWMFIIFLTVVNTAIQKDYGNFVETANGMSDFIFAIGIVVAQTALVIGVLKALANATTKLCEGEGNALGHKAWGMMMGAASFLGGMVVPGGFMGKMLFKKAGGRARNIYNRIRPQKEEPQTHTTEHSVPIDNKNYDNYRGAREEKNEVTPRSRTIRGETPVKEIKTNDKNILHLDKKELDKITKPKDKEATKLADNIKAAIHKTKEDLNVKTAENIAAEKPKVIKRKGLKYASMTAADGHSPQRSKEEIAKANRLSSGMSMMDNLSKSAVKSNTSEGKSASEIIGEKQAAGNITIQTDNVGVDARGTVNMTGDKNNLAAEKTAQETKNDKLIEDLMNKPKADSEKGEKRKDQFDFKLMGKSAATTLGTIGGGMFNLGKKAFDIADKQFASEEYLKQKEARGKKWAESNEKWAERQKEANKAIKDFANQVKEAQDDLQVARDFGDEKAEAKALKKIERLKKKEKDIQKKVEKASTRNGKSFIKDITDGFKKAVTPEFIKVAKTIGENQESAKKLEDVKKELKDLKKIEKKQMKINRRVKRKQAQAEADKGRNNKK